MGKSRPWTDEEKKFLDENYDKMTYKEIGKVLGRDFSSVRVMASKRKLRKLKKHEKIKVGDMFTRLEVIEEISVFNGRENETKYRCLCHCEGKPKEEWPTRDVCARNLRDGSTKSCGCYWKDNASALLTKHGLCKEYGSIINVLNGMHHRCYNPESDAYHNYGGRGIGICDEWNMNKCPDAQRNFVEWSLANGYKKGLTIDRTNNDIGDYGPNNSAWKDRVWQANNRRNTKKYIIWDEEKTIRGWIEDERSVVKDFKLITDRIRRGWTPQDAILTPQDDSKKTSVFIGVSFVKDRKKWLSYIRIKGKGICLGEFNRQLIAALTRDDYIIDNNLDGYKLNFPEKKKAPEE